MEQSSFLDLVLHKIGNRLHPLMQIHQQVSSLGIIEKVFKLVDHFTLKSVIKLFVV